MTPYRRYESGDRVRTTAPLVERFSATSAGTRGDVVSTRTGCSASLGDRQVANGYNQGSQNRAVRTRQLIGLIHRVSSGEK
jgi:hypothetical protein